MQKVLLYFQTSICVPLNIGEISLSGVTMSDELLKDIS